MGSYATIKGIDKCPKCEGRSEWQSKGLWLNYKGRDFWIGDDGDIKLDKNINGHIACYCYEDLMSDSKKGCGKISYYKIIKGKLIKSTEENYTK